MKKNKILVLALFCLGVLLCSGCSSRSALNSSSSWPGITADGDVVYAANGGFVEAVRDGQKVWSYPESSSRSAFYAAPAADEDHVFAGSYSNHLLVLNKADGSLAADIEVGNTKNKIIASPLLADGKVIVLSSGGMVSSYPADAAGESIAADWQTTLSGEVWVKPVCENGSLYVASMDKKMNVLDAKTGEVKQTIDISGAIMSDPILADGKIYFSTLANEVDEMDPETLEIRPLLTTEGELWASPLLMGDKLITADMNGIVYIVDVNTAETVWKSDKLTANKVGFIASPVALDDANFLLVDETGEIMIYDLDGKSVGQRTMSQSVYTTPVIMDNGTIVLVPVSDNGQLKAYAPELKEEWIYTRTSEKDSKEENKEGK